MQSLSARKSLARGVTQYRSIRKRLCEENVYSCSNALEIIFPQGRTRTAALLFAKWLKGNGGYATKNAVSNFSNMLSQGKLSINGIPFTYSRRNFYMTVLKTLLELGFIQRNAPVWDERSKKTLYVYERNIFDIPSKPPGVGFWRLAYYVCRKWNELFLNTDE